MVAVVGTSRRMVPLTLVTAVAHLKQAQQHALTIGAQAAWEQKLSQLLETFPEQWQHISSYL